MVKYILKSGLFRVLNVQLSSLTPQPKFKLFQKYIYYIGYGGLDHILASGRNVKVLVLETEVYSNTGGQSSKSTARAAVAKFSTNGKSLPKKDLGLIAMAYGYVYVAHVAMGASDQQTLTTFQEAEVYYSPCLIIAYGHGVDMYNGLEQQKLAIQTGYWPLYRYNPALITESKNPLLLISKEPSVALEKFVYNEMRFNSFTLTDEPRAEQLLKLAE